MSSRTVRWLVAVIILLIAAFLALQIWTLRLGLHRYRSGDFDGAFPVLKVARILNPFSKSASLALADIYLVNGEIDKAEKLLRATVARNPKDAPAHNLLGVAIQAKGRQDDAMSEYDLAIELDPKFALAHFNRGYLLLRTGQLEKGMEALNKAVKLEPNLAKNRDEILFLLGTALPPAPEPFTPKQNAQ